MKDLWEEENDNPLKLQGNGTMVIELNGIKLKQNISKELYEMCYKILTNAGLRKFMNTNEIDYELPY